MMPTVPDTQKPTSDIFPILKEEKNYKNQTAVVHYSLAGSHPQGSSAFKGVPQRDQSCIDYLAQIAEVQPNDFVIEVVRKSPALDSQGKRLKIGPVYKQSTVSAFQYIYDNVEQLHGGGQYQLRVLNLNGQVCKQMNFAIEGEPIFTDADEAPARFGATGAGFRRGSMTFDPNRRLGSYTDLPVGPEDDDWIKTVKKERQLQAEASLSDAELRNLQKERALSKERNKPYEEAEKIRKEEIQ
jgi:hypothetical protein